MAVDLEALLVPPDATVREAMACIDRNQAGIALVVDEDRKLLGTITDGDVRRAILASFDLAVRVGGLLEEQRRQGRPSPVTAPQGTAAVELLDLMERQGVRQVPLLDESQNVVGLALLDELVKSDALGLRAVVMAGGFGRRLGELTAETPKPMLPVGEMPLLERIVGQLRDAGIHHVNLTTHYRAEAISDHFGDGERFGVSINYVDEAEPLGTAGGIGMLEDSDEPLLVMNGDLLTKIDIRAFVAFHDDHRADATVAVLPYELEIPFGVLQLDGVQVTEIAEKPLLRRFVNAGVYLVSPDVRRSVPRGERCEMTDLIEQLIRAGRSVVAFPLHEYWLDIGEVEAYEQAQRDVKAT